MLINENKFDMSGNMCVYLALNLGIKWTKQTKGIPLPCSDISWEPNMCDTLYIQQDKRVSGKQSRYKKSLDEPNSCGIKNTASCLW